MEQSDNKNYLNSEQEFFEEIEEYYRNSTGSYNEKMHAFCRFVPRQSIAYFLARAEIYNKIINIHGSILDFGVYRGSSLFSWMQLASIYEPYNHLRKIIGFDSFDGFSEITQEDNPNKTFKLKNKGGMFFNNGSQELARGVKLLSLNKPLGHISSVEIVSGVLPQSAAKYINEHEETIIAMANFGLGLYKPTKEILKLIKPRLVNGSILVFEELNQSNWPGETKALFEIFSSKEFELKRFNFTPHLSYLIYKGE